MLKNRQFSIEEKTKGTDSHSQVDDITWLALFHDLEGCMGDMDRRRARSIGQD